MKTIEENMSGNLPGDNRAYQIVVPCVIFFIFTPLFVGIRLWARMKLRGWSGFGWDDWSIVAAWIFATIVMGLMVASCTYGFGQHIANLSKPNRLMTLKLFYVAQAFYKLTINLTKSSILLLYLRIFPKIFFKRCCLVLLVLILAYMVGTTASSIWQCSPIPRAWDKSIPGTCISITANWYANAGFSIATDVIILALPMYPLYTSHLPRSQKIALMVVFALGLFTTITSILRMQTLNFSSTSPDVTYDIESSIWTMIEENLAIICACLPVCRLPLSYVLPHYFSSSNSEGSSGNRSDFSSGSRSSGWKKSRERKVLHKSGSSESNRAFNDGSCTVTRESRTGLGVTVTVELERVSSPASDWLPTKEEEGIGGRVEIYEREEKVDGDVEMGGVRMVKNFSRNLNQ
ncbi:Satratoxin biosynthesis SC1 cluster protein 4 [Podospora australis]|uniref:Satratoxin biosynthesis SC1 cluster protein 4 n=1 Tax=Podospora australis TaxID=1536484 RepID=A0AAN6WTH3_9PEZI|nr:Satratoxin biosynthesis SC1 cluster protein 4 [Podospora australis]